MTQLEKPIICMTDEHHNHTKMLQPNTIIHMVEILREHTEKCGAWKYFSGNDEIIRNAKNRVTRNNLGLSLPSL